MRFPDKIRELADRYGSLSAASRKTDIPYQTLIDLKRGETRDPRYSTIKKLAAAEGKTPWDYVHELEGGSA